MLNKFFSPFSSIIPLSRNFSSRLSIFKEDSLKTLRFDRMFIFLCSFVIIRTFFLYNRNTMSVKRKLNAKNLNEKCKALRDLESGLSNKRLLQSMKCPKIQSLPGLKIKQSFLLHWNNVLIKKETKRK